MGPRFVKYNPAFLTDEELIQNFVVRHKDLEMILGIIKENTTSANQHMLAIGPRGSGKTTLVLRAAAEINRSPELRKGWYPLIFSEESYLVTTATDFWLEALFHLARQTGEEKWQRAYDEMRSETDNQKIGDRPLYQLLDFADSRNKRILLIVENLNMLFADLSGRDEAWKMRHTLSNEPRIALLATATSHMEELENPSFAMFEGFKMHDLRSLDDDECNTLWASVAGKPLPGQQIRPIRILTGGNSRLLVIIARFGAHRSFRQLLDDLVDLIDDHTDYFKGRIDHIPATERKVYLTLAELWEPSTARQVAKAARLDVNKTSSLLGRLVGKGDVVVSHQSKKTKWYRLSEGIYNIYYFMRRRGNSADRVKAVVRFMVAMYGPESASTLLTQEACRLGPDSCRDHYMAYGEIIRSIKDRQVVNKIINATPQSFLEVPYIRETLQQYIASPNLTDANENNANQINEKLNLISDMFRKGNQFQERREYADAISIYDEIVDRYLEQPEKEIAELVAMAFVVKGATLEILKRLEDAISVYDVMIARFEKRPEEKIAVLVAMALFLKGVTLKTLSKPKEAELALLKAIEIDPESLISHMELTRLLLQDEKRREEASTRARETIRRQPDDHGLLNAFAWDFYKQHDTTLLGFAEHWAQQAVTFVPENSYYARTSACILCGLGKGAEALAAAKKYVQDADAVENTIEDAIELFVGLAAAGLAKEAIALIENTPSAKHLEPLIVGLKLHIGEDVNTAVEILEVARDVAARITERVKA